MILVPKFEYFMENYLVGCSGNTRGKRQRLSRGTVLKCSANRVRQHTLPGTASRVLLASSKNTMSFSKIGGNNPTRGLQSVCENRRNDSQTRSPKHKLHFFLCHFQRTIPFTAQNLGTDIMRIRGTQVLGRQGVEEHSKILLRRTGLRALHGEGPEGHIDVCVPRTASYSKTY